MTTSGGQFCFATVGRDENRTLARIAGRGDDFWKPMVQPAFTKLKAQGWLLLIIFPRVRGLPRWQCRLEHPLGSACARAPGFFVAAVHIPVTLPRIVHSCDLGGHDCILPEDERRTRVQGRHFQESMMPIDAGRFDSPQ